MQPRKVLIVAGDYDLVTQAKSALSDRSYELQFAYSHLDALYALRHDAFDIALVDAAMFDRRTGEATIIALASKEPTLPVVAYVSDALSDINARRSAREVVTSLEARLLRTVMQRAGGKPVPGTRHLMTDTLTDPSSETPLVKSNGAAGWRDEEIQTLLAVGRSLTEVLDLSEVLNRVVEAARRLTNADEGMILMPEGEEMILRARVGIDIEVARNFRVKTRDTLAGEVFDRGQPTLIGAAGPLKVKTEYFVNSLVYVPILLKGRSIGVLGVNNKTKHDLFDLRHQELLENLASYAAIAIENARVHEQSIRRNRELKALVDASQSINTSLSMEVLLPTLCDQLLRIISVNYAEIFRWNAQDCQLLSLARSVQSVYPPGQEPTLDPRRSAALRDALDIGKPMWSERSAVLFIPIVGGSQVYGVIQTHYREPPAELPPNDVLQRVGRIALETLTSLSPSQPERHYRQANEIIELLGAMKIDLAIMIGAAGKLRVVLSVGRDVWVADRHPALDIAAHPDLIDAIETETPLAQRLGGSASTSGGKALLEAAGCRSLLAIPLVYRGDKQGLVMFADISEHRQFTSREVELARTLVGQGAVALANARLLSDLETSLRELRETQARLIQTERLSAMGELAAAVAHQVNNPLATIVLDTQLLLERRDIDTDMHDGLNAILRAGKRAATVVRRLLASARADSASQPPEAVDVVQTVTETIALVRSYIQRDHIKLVISLPAHAPPPVFMPPGELDDVWLNLIMNAHDVLIGRPDAELGVEVYWEPGQDEVVVAVWDNGPGIPEDIQADIFKPFFTTKKPGEGTGIGLHICRQVVERAGGVISFETWTGAGTRFTVQLPLMKRGIS